LSSRARTRRIIHVYISGIVIPSEDAARHPASESRDLAFLEITTVIPSEDGRIVHVYISGIVIPSEDAAHHPASESRDLAF